MAWLEAYAYPAVFAAVLLDTLGLPVPGEVILLATGFLVSAGRIEPIPAILLATLAAVLGDSATYWLGRRVGRAGERRLIELYCAWTACTLGSARCVEQAETWLRRLRGGVVIVAKFVAGARVFVPPVAGAAALEYPRFLLLDAAGSLAWTTLVVTGGALAGRSWTAAARSLEQASQLAGLVLLGILGCYLGWKVARRRLYGDPARGFGTAGAAPASSTPLAAGTPGLS